MLDVAIIGGAAAGSAAAVYASRAELKLKIISLDWGGEVARAGEILNYPGFSHTNGIELAQIFLNHVKANDIDIETGVKVESIKKETDGTFAIIANKGTEKVVYRAKSVIIATGVHPRPLNVPGEVELKHRGLSYCTTCDGPLFKDKIVTTIGGGNSALESALVLSKIAKKVYLINKNPVFKGEKTYISQVIDDPKVTVIYNGLTQKILGQQKVEAVEYKDVQTGETKTIQTQGVFIHAGLIPNSSFVESVTKNNFGEIVVDKFAATNIEGLFAAGDVSDLPYKQIVISAGHGATAALSVVNYLNMKAEDFKQS